MLSKVVYLKYIESNLINIYNVKFFVVVFSILKKINYILSRSNGMRLEAFFQYQKVK